MCLCVQDSLLACPSLLFSSFLLQILTLCLFFFFHIAHSNMMRKKKIVSEESEEYDSFPSASLADSNVAVVLQHPALHRAMTVEENSSSSSSSSSSSQGPHLNKTISAVLTEQFMDFDTSLTDKKVVSSSSTTAPGLQKAMSLGGDEVAAAAELLLQDEDTGEQEEVEEGEDVAADNIPDEVDVSSASAPSPGKHSEAAAALEFSQRPRERVDSDNDDDDDNNNGGVKGEKDEEDEEEEEPPSTTTTTTTTTSAAKEIGSPDSAPRTTAQAAGSASPYRSLFGQGVAKQVKDEAKTAEELTQEQMRRMEEKRLEVSDGRKNKLEMTF